MLTLALLACHSPAEKPEEAVLAEDTSVRDTGGVTDSRGDTDTGEETDADTDTDTDPDTDTDSDTDSDIDTADTGPTVVPTDLDLDLDSGIVKLVGEAASSGYEMGASAAGDVNGDGYADLLVGLPAVDQPGADAEGTVYVVYGPVGTSIDLSDADAKVVGGIPEDIVGPWLAPAGDTDLDGYDDFLVGSPSLDPTGAAYLVRGPVTGDLALEEPDATLVGEFYNGYRLFSEAGDGLAGGDFDGDGYSDALVGAPGYWEGQGAVYLVEGPMSGTVHLGDDADMSMIGTDGDMLGWPLANGGDTDGDGVDDIVIGWPLHDSSKALLLLGPVSGVLSPGDADGAFVVTDDDGMGYSIDAAGDVDGDGYGDVVLGYTPEDDSDYVGGALLFRGPLLGDVDVADAEAHMVGETEEGRLGISASGAGDVDGDGHDDVVLGASHDVYHDEGGGAAYLFLGPLSGSRSASEADFRFFGDGDDRAGEPVDGVGDVDGDGLDDLLIAGEGDDDGGTDAGAAWIVYGALLATE